MPPVRVLVLTATPLVPLNAVGFAGGVVVPSNQYWPPVTPTPTSAADIVSVTLAVPWTIVYALRAMLESVGATLSITRIVVAVLPQLPAASLPRTKMVWLPWDNALIVERGMSPYPTSCAAFQAPSAGTNAKPLTAVLAGAVSMNPSAPPTVDPVLLMVAVTRRLFALAAAAPLFGFGAALTADVTGPLTTLLRTIEAGRPQLPNASWLRTETGWLPVERPLMVACAMVAERLAFGPATLTVIATGAPPSIVYSAAAMLVLPVALSLAAAASATLAAPLLGLGVSVRAEVDGPALSRFRTAEPNAPQLLFVSIPCT